MKPRLLGTAAGLLLFSYSFGLAANHSTSTVSVSKAPVTFKGQDNRDYQSQIATTKKAYFPDRGWFLFLAASSGVGALSCIWFGLDNSGSSSNSKPVAKKSQVTTSNDWRAIAKPPVTLIPNQQEGEDDDDEDTLDEEEEIEDAELEEEEYLDISAPIVKGSQTTVASLNDLRKQQENQDWIRPLVFKGETKEFKTQHFHVCGATNSGKSTLVSYIVDLISSKLDSVELFLINPKHIESDPQWSFDPFVKDIEDVLPGLEHIWEKVLSRRKDPRFDKRTASKIIAIVDEWDWIKEEYGTAAIKIARKITKVGRALNVHIIFSGQSALCTDTGFSTSDYKNVARIVLTDSALQLIGNVKSFPYSLEFRKGLAQISERYLAENKRFALVVPMGSMPFVSLIPHIELEDRISSNETEKELVAANG